MPGIPIADLVSGLHGLWGVLMALLRRATTGKGDYIDISMHEALMASCANVVGRAFTEGKQPDVKNQRTTGGAAFYRIYDTRDGRQLVLAGQEMKFIRNLLTALGKPEYIALCEWPGAHQKPVNEFLAATFKAKPLAHWMEFLAPARYLLRPGQHVARSDRGSEPAEARRIVTDRRRPKALRPVVRFKDEPSHRSIASRYWVNIRRQFCHPERSEGVDLRLKCNSLLEKTSAGVLKSRHFRGVLLRAATRLSRLAVFMVSRFVLRGKYLRRRPMVFSTEPFCQGLCGSQKYVRMASWSLRR